jgi:hypothetical protein
VPKPAAVKHLMASVFASLVGLLTIGSAASAQAGVIARDADAPSTSGFTQRLEAARQLASDINIRPGLIQAQDDGGGSSGGGGGGGGDNAWHN